MTINIDTLVLWQWGFFTLNATLLFTWLVMALLVLFSWWVSRGLSQAVQIPGWQNLLEVLVTTMQDQIHDVSRQPPAQYLPFVGTLFLFIALSNLLAIVPGYRPPTASFSTTLALAIWVFVAVPIYGISQQGLKSYLKQYIQPTPFMLPFNILGELSRTVALAVRLYGNVMSGTVIVAILLGIAPLFFPIVMQLLGMLTGMIQAYIFSILAMVYIASATVAHQKEKEPVSNGVLVNHSAVNNSMLDESMVDEQTPIEEGQNKNAGEKKNPSNTNLKKSGGEQHG